MTFAYNDRLPHVLSVEQLGVSSGELVSVLGASGCGKSTLLRLVAGLLLPTTGRIHRRGLAGNPGMVFQSPTLIPWRSARDNVLLPSELGQGRTIDERRLAELFDMVGFAQQDTQKRPGELSGGMQMRVSIARALVLEPQLLLLDEPFAALDDLLRMQLEEDVRQIHSQRGLTTLLVTHNINEAVFMSDRVVVLGGTPSGVAADIPIDLSERDQSLRSAPAFHALVEKVTQSLYRANGMESDGPADSRSVGEKPPGKTSEEMLSDKTPSGGTPSNDRTG
ncbi:MAG: ABC transporter ATP-binding protein [Planctomycetaceae bacterium]|nr:ABC transporter ATP-binding protein [Planctomycetaceae bacterium]